ncbi:MAG: alpha,alpha-trehalose-phosphate synthase (UDP-forming) [Actinomycetia bacterium]|nr:alpha,alpha-trehalose-phosphate synthase (UDP-forming) [Actinomycetes bacterium]
MPERPVVVVSNRGPLSFTLEDGELRTKKGGGGLVTALGPAIDGTGALWVAGALSEADRKAAAQGGVEAEGFNVDLLALDEDDYAAYYDVISNGTLWFLHHELWDIPRRPRFDRVWRQAWDAYRRVNQAFADHVAEVAPDGAVVLVQDYHLALMGEPLAAARPDLALVHFHHTPFASPDAFRVLPVDAGEELLRGLAAFRACGFHNARWAAAFEACCAEVLGTTPATFVTPAEADADDIRAVAASAACATAGAALEEAVHDRRFIVRVDRIELSKNIVRGFLAFDDLLRTYPEWRERVTFGAFVYPSREGLAEYQAYRQEVEGVIQRINAEWSTATWTPILYDPQDDFPRSVAALQRYDVLLVNPVRDGLNLVAKEGLIVNERDGVLALSRESGVWAELDGIALEVHPFDVAGTADVLHRALSMSTDERRAHAEAGRERVLRRTAIDWFGDQVAAGG